MKLGRNEHERSSKGRKESFALFPRKKKKRKQTLMFPISGVGRGVVLIVVGGGTNVLQFFFNRLVIGFNVAS